jgi:hypothetical protein
MLMIMLMLGNVGQVAFWHLLHRALGAFEGFEEAVCFSGVKFTSLDYGDVVLHGSARLLTPLQAANDLMMSGSRWPSSSPLSSDLSPGGPRCTGLVCKMDSAFPATVNLDDARAVGDRAPKWHPPEGLQSDHPNHSSGFYPLQARQKPRHICVKTVLQIDFMASGIVLASAKFTVRFGQSILLSEPQR